MEHPLWLLTKLKFKASWRRLLRSAKTPRGILLLAFTIGFFGLMLASQIAVLFTNNKQQIGGGFIENYGPFFLLAYSLFLLVTSVGEQAVSFTPSEVDLLFPAPLSRRELLVYKLLNNISSTIFLGLLLAVTNRLQYHLWVAGLVGFFLTFTFLQLLGILVSFIGQSFSKRIYTRGRQFVAAGVIAVLAFASSSAMMQWEGEKLSEIPRLIESSMTGRIVLSPFRLFCDVITAERIFPDFLASASIAISIIGAMLFCIFKLDTDFSEIAVRVTKMRYEKLQKMQRGNMVMNVKNARTTRIPMPPFWRGTDPIFWRQLVRTIRSMSVLGRILLIVGLGLSWPIYRQLSKTTEISEATPFVVWGALIYVSTLLTGALPVAFRADIERMGVFKSLPVSPWSVVAGQLAGPTILLSVFHGLLFAGLTLILPQFWMHWLIGAVISPFFNFVLLAVSNGLFLFFPVRVTAGSTPDFQTGMKNMLMFMLQYLALGVLIGIVAAGSVGTFFLTKSLLFAAIMAVILLSVECLLGLILVWTGYTRFDVTKHLP